ncbi:MAG TPA: NAD(P)H-dependent oxidoreductase [Acidimicrobiales bacterium]|nr:NAD(P)H-dependent oxidoreductase [Acidimicrobiales bacterium]
MPDIQPVRLQVILGSTRPVRAGEPIARWVIDAASARSDFDVELIDLAVVNLPPLDEPRQASDGDYQHEHTRQWSATIQRGDAVIFVLPEYNHSYNAATKNALDYLYKEWRYKAAGIVCYGGGARGTRAAQHLKTVLSSLKMVHVGDVAVGLGDAPVVDGEFAGTPQLNRALSSLFDETARLIPHLRTLREAARGAHH